MVELNKIMDFLCGFAPTEYAESYDNVGLLVGDKNKQVKKVLITLDADQSVIDDAVQKECDLVISHHPLIFTPLKRIVTGNSTTETVISLIKSDICLISMHTNFDSVASGLCDLLLDKIADTKERVSIEGDEVNGSGRIAELVNMATLSDVLNKVKKEFSLDKIRYVGELESKIYKIAVCNGGGADFIYTAKDMGADVYISGDIKYHHARFAYENGISLIEVPHYDAEIIFCEYMKDLLKKEFGNDLDILITDKNKDVWKSI
ncbi:MAG: Nif3-like dinuclear metal center hexameric protein [Clostridia bacterium]|nr:Nif3-like dinuclear metal center hexameric protein [Clostridia bacterium]